jgi:hypothetical protein
MTQHKDTTHKPNTLETQNKRQSERFINTLLDCLLMAGMVLLVLILATYCQPVEASNKIGNKPRFYATKRAVLGNYRNACIPCQSRDRACNKHQFMQQNLCEMHQKTLESNHQK